ncbi:MAG: ABC transporter ATP-binding protein [Peptoniphilaceae bacterium]|uniref:ABC transporter ATP-binding protein n=1 Tax=Parvimonas sp. TaxID=1944660 RepID=UPI002A75CE3F|nr:ABC transporter ATP-binding protein [Parvimonas sp.]MDD7765530.1 ABC transporter ATP-binding protein [Peptoniphilaceae bacterium]MDY3051071.1 ABC transporter ATP-binding protein [Parvimonas sp.]
MKNNNFVKYKKLISYIGPYKKKRIFVTFLSALSTIVSAIIPFILGTLIDKVQTNQPLKNIIQYALFISLIGMLNIFLNSLQNYKWHVFKVEFTDYFRSLMVSSFLKKKTEYCKKNYEDLSSRILQDTEIISKDISVGFPMLFLNMLNLGLVMFFMVRMSIKLTLVVLFVVPIFTVFFGIMQNSVQSNSIREREEFSNLTESVKEYIDGIFQIKIFKKELFFLNKFKENIKIYEKYLKKMKLFTAVGYGIMNVTVIMLPIIILILGAIDVHSGKLTLGNLFSFYFYLSFIYEPMQNLTNWFTNIQISLGMSDRIINFLEEDIEDITVGEEISKVNEIQIKNLSFSYDGKQDVLKNINFDLQKGDIVGVIGSSGSGKSTLIDILLKFWSNYSGSILIDGKELKNISKDSYYNLVSYLEQNTFLFRGNLKENITLGNLDDEKFFNSINLSKVDKFLKDNVTYEFDIESNGKNVSGGEKQRISLARSIYKDSDLLILDEFTSALDTELEKEIVENIKEISKDKIILIITHRKEPLSICNKILNMENFKSS